MISSWLLDLTAEAYLDDPISTQYSGHVSDSGEGRWTINAAIDEGVPVPVLSAALYQRFSSRGRSDVADQVLSAMRAGFGGHKNEGRPDDRRAAAPRAPAPRRHRRPRAPATKPGARPTNQHDRPP